MNEPLPPGAKVTLVLLDHSVQVEVTMSHKDGFWCTLTSRAGKSIESKHLLSEEGVTWLSGYHSADSDAVKACRVAAGLAGKYKEPKQDPLDSIPSYPGNGK